MLTSSIAGLDSVEVLAFAANDARLVALPVTVLLRSPLVALLLAAPDTKFDFGDPPFVEIDRQRYDRDALALDGAHQAVHFPLMDQQLARSFGFMLVVLARQLVFRNIGVYQIKRAVLLTRIGLGDARLAGTKGFHLRTDQHDPRLKGFVDEVVKPGAAVLSRDPARDRTRPSHFVSSSFSCPPDVSPSDGSAQLSTPAFIIASRIATRVGSVTGTIGNRVSSEQRPSRL